jgi:hypothetical protein
VALPAFVQGVRDSALGGSGTTWTTAAFPALGAGNTVVMVVNTFTPSIPPAIASITDNAGNVYQKLVGQVQYDSFGDDEQELWGLVKVNGGATTITVTFVKHDRRAISHFRGIFWRWRLQCLHATIH